MVGGLGVVQPDPRVVVGVFIKYQYSSKSNWLSEPNMSLGYRFSAPSDKSLVHLELTLSSYRCLVKTHLIPLK